MEQISVRLLPDQDLKQEIEKITKENNIKAGVIVSAVGSLKITYIRMAGAKDHKEWNEEVEIVSLQGTVSIYDPHLHISVSLQDGTVVGGHLKSGCIIKTTVELVILVFDDVEYKRKIDTSTGYEELDIIKHS